MLPWSRAAKLAQDVADELNRLATRVEQLEHREAVPLGALESRLERLELDHGERHVAVLNTMEKLMRQLGARERKRERDAEDGDGGQDVLSSAARPDFVDPAGSDPSRRAPDTSHLAGRFRRF